MAADVAPETGCQVSGSVRPGPEKRQLQIAKTGMHPSKSCPGSLIRFAQQLCYRQQLL